MSTTEIHTVDPAISQFVGVVRGQLHDLPEDERADLIEGMEADLEELVAERGVEALGNPLVYARELRQAAGLAAEPPRLARRGSVGQSLDSYLSGVHESWRRFVEGLPGDVNGFLSVLQPVWWVARAWLACQCVFLVAGGSVGATVPTGLVQLAFLLVAVVVSVQIGRGKWWPNQPNRGGWTRLLLVGLNAFAVVVAVVLAGSVNSYGIGGPTRTVYVSEPAPQGLYINGHQVTNVYPYDATGQPLVGIQLVDQAGRRLSVGEEAYDSTGANSFVFAPWMNGQTKHYSVFPLPQATLPVEPIDVNGNPVPVESPVPTMQPFPFAQLPPVTNEGITPSVLTPPAPVVPEGQAPEPAQKQAQKKGQKQGQPN